MATARTSRARTKSSCASSPTRCRRCSLTSTRAPVTCGATRAIAAGSATRPRRCRGRHVQRGARRGGVGAAPAVRRARARRARRSRSRAGSTTRTARPATFAPPTSRTGIREDGSAASSSCPTTSARSGPPSGRCAGASTCWNARSRPRTSAAGRWRWPTATASPQGTVRWSDETFRMFGYEPGAFAVTHASFFEYIHPEDRERDARRLAADRSSAASRSRTNSASCGRDGTVRTMHTWTDFERDAAGKPIRMVGTCQDVTERKRAEQELREADRRKDEFLAMLSHELRNPLAPILNAIEIIERAGPERAGAALDVPGGHRAAGPAHEAAARRSAGRLARQPGQDRAAQAAASSWRRCCCRRWRSAAR